MEEDRIDEIDDAVYRTIREMGTEEKISEFDFEVEMSWRGIVAELIFNELGSLVVAQDSIVMDSGRRYRNIVIRNDGVTGEGSLHDRSGVGIKRWRGGGNIWKGCFHRGK